MRAAGERRETTKQRKDIHSQQQERNDGNFKLLTFECIKRFSSINYNAVGKLDSHGRTNWVES